MRRPIGPLVLRRSRALALLRAFCLVAPAACQGDATVLVGTIAGGAPSALDAGATPVDARAQGDSDTGAKDVPAQPIGVAPGTRQQFCEGQGPAVRVMANEPVSQAVCNAQIARKLFRHGVCSCADLSLTGEKFTVDAFDSRAGPYSLGETGAAVATSGSLQGVARDTRILGSLTVAGGLLRVPSAAVLRVEGDLKTSAAVESAGATLSVARDVWLGAPIDASSAAAITVGRDLITPTGAAPPGADVKGRLQSREVELDVSCGCGRDALDIAGLVAQVRASSSDNEGVGLSERALADTLSGLPTALACGRFALDEVSTFGNTLLTVHERTALFVAGDFTVTGNLVLDLGERGELDVFVAGNLDLAVLGLASIGDTRRPGALRFYVAGDKPITILGASTLSALLYAPHASVQVGVNTTLLGSVVSANFVGSDGAVHYDRAVVDLGEACVNPQALVCESPGECAAGLACVANGCAPCGRDEDCSMPHVCTDHSCQALRI